MAPTLCVSAIKNEMTDTLRVLHGVGYRDRAALRNAKQGKTFESRRIDDRLEITHESVEGDVEDIPVRQARTAFVVAQERVVAAQRLDPVLPDRARKVEFQMIEPIGGFHQRRPGAD